ncbi:SlyX family protein [Marinimicrobium sp. ABcell2]|uniref:SlyX family protein n=1 Tax=Marinimicrobium sp. ABcell2 TaxID=3069751 RepID=UPI0027AE4A23|nr:SlyX family protein [Marinimicrobium sp. ABcell2]MDQ2075346.1 SlyX family protein [Marinimicrobium sp. ABcell2]
MNTLEDQIIELQSRLAFQEDTLNELNGVVVEQATQIDQLRQQLRSLAEQYQDLRHHQGAEGEDQPPPHY